MTATLETRLRRIEARHAAAAHGVEVVIVPEPAPTDWDAFAAEHRTRAVGKQLLFIEFVDTVPQP